MPSILERDTVNAFCRHTHAEAAGTVSGPLAGLTFGAKDIYDVAGQRTGFGSPDWFARHPPASRTAAAVAALLDQAGLTADDVDLFVFHQANRYMLEQLRRKLAIRGRGANFPGWSARRRSASGCARRI